MALALYRKYRPRTFAEVIGQEHVTEPLSQALRSGRLHHAYLFSGPRGCGKTSSARILARSLNCEQGPTPEPCGVCASCRSLANDGTGSIDVIEIDAASHGGVDDARDLREKAFFAPASSRYKIYVIDEAHMVSSAGFNALLKLVEEPPDYVKFIFATTEPEKVLGTIRSRTHHYPFRLIPPAVLRPYLQQLTEAEGVHVDPAVLPLVVRAGGGSARDTLSVLDQLISGAGPEGVSYPRAVSLLGVTDVALIDEMCDALAAGDGAAAYQTIDRVAEAGHDPRRFASDLLERFRDLIVLQQVPDAVSKGLIDGPADQLEQMGAQATRLGPATLSRCADIVHNGLVEMRGTTAPRLLLELITARMLLPGADDANNALLQRLERMERRLTLTTDEVRPEPATAAQSPSPSPAPAGGGGGISAARAAAAAAGRRAPAGGVPGPASSGSAVGAAAPVSSAGVGSAAPVSVVPGAASPVSAAGPSAAGPVSAAGPSAAGPVSAAGPSAAASVSAAGSSAAGPVSGTPVSGGASVAGPVSGAPAAGAASPVAGEPDLGPPWDTEPEPDPGPPWETEPDVEPPWATEPGSAVSAGSPGSPAAPVSAGGRPAASTSARTDSGASSVSAAPTSGTPVSTNPVSGGSVPPGAGPAAPASGAPAPTGPVLGSPNGGPNGGPAGRRPEPAGLMPDAPEEPGYAPQAEVPGQLSAAAIREVWPEIMTAVSRKSKKIAALAQGATVRDLEGQTVVLTFRFPAHAKMVAAEPTLISDALYEALGGRWQIRCDVAGESGPSPGSGGSAPVGPRGGPAGPAQRSPQAQDGPPRQETVRAAPTTGGAPARQRDPAPRASATVASDAGDEWPEPARPGGLATAVATQVAAPVVEDEDWPEPARPGGAAIAGRSGGPGFADPSVGQTTPLGDEFDGPGGGQGFGGQGGAPASGQGNGLGNGQGGSGGGPGGGPGGGLSGGPGGGLSGGPGGGLSGGSGGGLSGGQGGGRGPGLGGGPGGGQGPALGGGPSGGQGAGLSGGPGGGLSGGPGGSPSSGPGGSPSGGQGTGGPGNTAPGSTIPSNRAVSGTPSPNTTDDRARSSDQPGTAAERSRNSAPTAAAAPVTSGRPPSSGLAAARAAAAGAGRGTNAASPARTGPWSDGSPTEEAPYDPEYDGPPRPDTARPNGSGGPAKGGGPAFEGFDPGDEPLDDVIDEKTARQSSEQQAVQLLRDALGAEKISES
ncbi:DNA polymerase III subunit gamma and tau [Actinoplanes sp. NPDC004185]